jgi:arabinogalactan endo-1,4-beta-galactosidase
MGVSIILIFLSCSNVSSSESSSTNEKIFIKGVDVSTLNEVESSGVRFYYNGIQTDVVKILKNFGVNWIRVINIKHFLIGKVTLCHL